MHAVGLLTLSRAACGAGGSNRSPGRLLGSAGEGNTGPSPPGTLGAGIPGAMGAFGFVGKAGSYGYGGMSGSPILPSPWLLLSLVSPAGVAGGGLLTAGCGGCCSGESPPLLDSSCDGTPGAGGGDSVAGGGDNVGVGGCVKLGSVDDPSVVALLSSVLVLLSEASMLVSVEVSVLLLSSQKKGGGGEYSVPGGGAGLGDGGLGETPWSLHSLLHPSPTRDATHTHTHTHTHTR